MASLIIITGPIGVGKSTVAQALVNDIRRRDRSAAAIDMDLLYLMMSEKPMGNENVWLQARHAAAALTDSFHTSGIEFVILEGQFWDIEERSAFQNKLIWQTKPLFVTLLVSFEEALLRVRGDLTRGISRNREFLKIAHTEFEAIVESLKTTDLVLDSTQRTALQIASAIFNKATFSEER